MNRLLHLARGIQLVPIVLVATIALLVPNRAQAQSAENVAVVINETSPASIQVGEYYIRKRAIPAANVIRIRTGVEENIDRAAYTLTIENPIAAALARQSLQDRI